MTDAERPGREEDIEPLRRWERSWAGVAGTALAGAGAVSVFMTDNQAGSVGLLVSGTALLILAVNGTPLTRARFMDYEVELARQRRKAVVARVQEENPEEARRILEVLFTLDPEAATDPGARTVYLETYLLLLTAKLLQLFPGVRVRQRMNDYARADLTLASSANDALVEISVRPFPMRDMRRLRAIVQRNVVPRLLPLVVVTGGLPRVSEDMGQVLDQNGIWAVQWRGSGDDETLKAAIEAAFAEARDGG